MVWKADPCQKAEQQQRIGHTANEDGPDEREHNRVAQGRNEEDDDGLDEDEDHAWNNLWSLKCIICAVRMKAVYRHSDHWECARNEETNSSPWQPYWLSGLSLSPAEFVEWKKIRLIVYTGVRNPGRRLCFPHTFSLFFERKCGNRRDGCLYFELK